MLYVHQLICNRVLIDVSRRIATKQTFLAPSVGCLLTPTGYKMVIIQS